MQKLRHGRDGNTLFQPLMAGSVPAQRGTARCRSDAAESVESDGRFASGIGHKEDTPAATTANSVGIRQVLQIRREPGRELAQSAPALRGEPGG